jgi:hypothetical protein
MSHSRRGQRFWAEKLTGLGAERIEEDVFGGAALGLAGAIHAAAALRGADLDPVDGAIAGAGETGHVHQVISLTLLLKATTCLLTCPTTCCSLLVLC